MCYAWFYLSGLFLYKNYICRLNFIFVVEVKFVNVYFYRIVTINVINFSLLYGFQCWCLKHSLMFCAFESYRDLFGYLWTYWPTKLNFIHVLLIFLFKFYGELIGKKNKWINNNVILITLFWWSSPPRYFFSTLKFTLLEHDLHSLNLLKVFCTKVFVIHS